MRAELELGWRMPGLNEYVRAERGSARAAAAMKREQTGMVAAAARAARLPRFERPVMVSFTWVEPNRRRDVDNVEFAKKFVLDGLVQAGVLPDDSPAHVRATRDRVRYAGRGSVTVEITDEIGRGR